MFRIFGPPGTGKTTTLLDLVDKALENGAAPTEIAFLAFTRKAATEARERASQRFGLDPRRDLPYFRTLHSLAFRLTGLTTEQLMSGEHYKELEKRTGFELTGSSRADEEATTAIKKEAEILRLITLSRLKRTPLRVEYHGTRIKHTWTEVDYLARALEKYKKTNGLFDYTDMLELFVQKGPQICPHFELCLLDEAQDLSPIQWEIANILDNKSEKMYSRALRLSISLIFPAGLKFWNRVTGFRPQSTRWPRTFLAVSAGAIRKNTFPERKKVRCNAFSRWSSSISAGGTGW